MSKPTGYGGYLCEVIDIKKHQPARRVKTTMTINFVSLIFIGLLPLTARSRVTAAQDHNFTYVMTSEAGNKFSHDQTTAQDVSSSSPLLEDSSHTTRKSVIVDVNPTEEKMAKPSTRPSLQVTIQTAATSTNSTSSSTSSSSSSSFQLNSSTVGMKSTTEVQPKILTSPTTVVTSQAKNPIATTIKPRVPSVLRSSTQSQDAGKTLTSQFTSAKTIHPTTSTKPGENKSTSTSLVSGNDSKQSTTLYKTLPAITKTPFIYTTLAKKGKEQNQPEKKSKNGTNNSKAVAGLIGGALVLMMVGFLVIYIKKQKLQRQQITTRDWAGPSPFLEDGADNGQVKLRSSNRISLSSFLPQRLSKRLSLLPETDEELQDMTLGTTFGDKQQERIFQGVEENDGKKSKGTDVVVSEVKSTGNAPETVENSVSVSSSQTNDPLSKRSKSEVTNLSEEHPTNPPTLSGAVEKCSDTCK